MDINDKADQAIPPGVDTSKPSPARLYDYYLGGVHNFPVDREAAERIRTVMPDLADAAWANRGFHQRAAIWMAAQGVRQFLDIGSGLPTQGNTHEAVRRHAPDARVVYVDNDPMVAAYARQFIDDPARTAVVTGDLREPETVLHDPVIGRLIDPGQPTGLLMTAVVHFVADSFDPWSLVRSYTSAVAPGSYLALSHVTHEKLPERAVSTGREEYQRSSEAIFLRSAAEIGRFFDGLEIVPPYPGAEPGLCHVGEWGAEDPVAADSDGSRVFFCAVGLRP
ncbi:MAG: SAM-dependent methyltransferase [Streptosporangiaceae bacterium]